MRELDFSSSEVFRDLILEPDIAPEMEAFVPYTTSKNKLQELLSLFQKSSTDNEALIWGIHYNGKIIGFIGISDLKYDIPLAFYALNPEYRHQGLMKECLTAAAVFCRERFSKGIGAETKPNNTASVNLLTACGFFWNETEQLYYRN